MKDHPAPEFKSSATLQLVGRMAIYNSQAEASTGIPQQWRAFLSEHPELRSGAQLYGASPCTSDGKIHYLTGYAATSGSEHALEHLTVEAGEYASVRVDDAAALRDTWVWLLTSWLASSGRREKRAPEFERYTGISETGLPVGSTEIWIPLEPVEAR